MRQIEYKEVIGKTMTRPLSDDKQPPLSDDNEAVDNYEETIPTRRKSRIRGASSQIL
jgi:hypothetical protein